MVLLLVLACEVQPLGLMSKKFKIPLGQLRAETFSPLFLLFPYYSICNKITGEGFNPLST
jgi:hypothetical protein